MSIANANNRLRGMSSVERTVILGGRGNMASFLTQYLPIPITLIDIKDFDGISSKYLLTDRAVRKKASAELSALSRDGVAKKLSSLFILSMPSDIYERVNALPGINKLSNLIGFSGRGHRQTIFVHQTSVHEIPAKLLDVVSGPAFGIHFLHKPDVPDLSEQTAIVTVTEKKKRHDLYDEGLRIVMDLLRNKMGYGHIFTMSPERHDMIMSNIQYLTHSLFLIVADIIISSGYEIDSDNFLSLPTEILILAGRMFGQSAHVYRGIAVSNQHNESVSHMLKNLGDQSGPTLNDCIKKVIMEIGEIRDHMVDELRMSGLEIKNISTPMSRTRDGLINDVKPELLSRSNHVEISVKSFVKKYLKAIQSGYTWYFDSLSKKVIDELNKLDFQKIVMNKYLKKREINSSTFAGNVYPNNPLSYKGFNPLAIK